MNLVLPAPDFDAPDFHVQAAPRAPERRPALAPADLTAAQAALLVRIGGEPLAVIPAGAVRAAGYAFMRRGCERVADYAVAVLIGAGLAKIAEAKAAPRTFRRLVRLTPEGRRLRALLRRPRSLPPCGGGLGRGEGSNGPRGARTR